MTRKTLAEAVENVDQRLARVEQILPTLATKDDLKGLATKEDLHGLATKEELKALATKEELKALATKEELKPLATKEELKPLATKEELRACREALEARITEEGEAGRRYMKVLVEDLKDTVGLYAERLAVVDERDARQHAESVKATKALDGRVAALEMGARRKRG